ncbi:MAG: 30S ribosomal protein S12 methylthiotransferase RimO [Pseudomonadota bacterium]|nr:30S ribosomal protein S12 methylthiotransferase RimO [Pseudomonadota bacterium]
MKNLQTQTPNKKVHFVSLGCPKNLVDTEIMAGTLVKDGYEITTSPEQAQMLVVNTCGFIDDAKKESIDKILELAELKKQHPGKKLVVSGCLVQRYKDDLVKDMPEVDFFVGSGEFQNISKILKTEKRSGKKTFYNLPTYLQEESSPRINSGPKHRAYLKISEGCKKRCAFCAIPVIRGDLQSRTIKNVVSEAQLLVASGVEEIIVISHDFTDYGWDLRKKDIKAKESPVELLRDLSLVPGLKWIRLMYLYPDGITEELLDLIKVRPNILPYFDMPLQHINNEQLRKMNRKMTKEEITGRLALIRTKIPEAVIRTQFIVGFPGETDDQFKELLEFIKEQKFDRVGCCKYSPEENTGGFRMKDQVEEEVKTKRFDKLMSLQKTISKKKMRGYLGKTLQVLVEGVSPETELLLQGRYFGQAPEIDGVVLINEGTANPGTFVNVRVTDTHDYDLVGEII